MKTLIITFDKTPHAKNPHGSFQPYSVFEKAGVFKNGNWKKRLLRRFEDLSSAEDYCRSQPDPVRYRFSLDDSDWRYNQTQITGEKKMEKVLIVFHDPDEITFHVLEVSQEVKRKLASINGLYINGDHTDEQEELLHDCLSLVTEDNQVSTPIPPDTTKNLSGIFHFGFYS